MKSWWHFFYPNHLKLVTLIKRECPWKTRQFDIFRNSQGNPLKLRYQCTPCPSYSNWTIVIKIVRRCHKKSDVSRVGPMIDSNRLYRPFCTTDKGAFLQKCCHSVLRPLNGTLLLWDRSSCFSILHQMIYDELVFSSTAKQMPPLQRPPLRQKPLLQQQLWPLSLVYKKAH